MNIAVIDPFPNWPFTLEKKFLRQINIAGHCLGWQVTTVVTSDDIIAVAPDCVLTTHEFCPKLTGVPTFGLLWSPPVFFEHCKERRRNVLSLDGYLPGGPCVDKWLRKICNDMGKSALLGPYFWPSCHRTEFKPFKGGRRQLFYAGASWDGKRFGKRHEGLFEALEKKISLCVYGPASSWHHLGKAYCGEIPLDGTSLLARANDAGVALCLHKKQHREANLPSMRLFESAAAGCVLVVDDMPFTREVFGDAVLYVDASAGTGSVADQIAGHMAWIEAHPQSAGDMAEASHQVFVKKLCLERLLEPLPGFLNKVRQAQGYVASAEISSRGVDLGKDDEYPVIEVLMRIGSRPVEMVERSVKSISDQSYPEIAVTFIAFAEVSGLDSLIAAYEERFKWMRVIRPQQATTCRSTMLWKGLNAVEAPLFCNLDDDDCWHQNHLMHLYACLWENQHCSLAFSGCIAHKEDPPPFYWQSNFSAPKNQPAKVIPETRKIDLFEKADHARLWGNDNMILSCSWLARQRVLDKRVLQDPGLYYLEDVCFNRVLSAKTDFVFTGLATAVWHLRQERATKKTQNKRAIKAARHKMNAYLAPFRPPGLRPNYWYWRRLREITGEVTRISKVLLRNPMHGIAEVNKHMQSIRGAWKRRGKDGVVAMIRGKGPV